MKAQYFSLAVKNIRKKGVRSWLTMLGIFIGIAAVVSLTSLGQGMEDAIGDEFAKMGSDVIIIMPGTGFESMGSNKLTEHDERIIKNVRGVVNTAPMISKIAKVDHGREAVYTFVSGVPVDDRYKILQDMESFDIEEGRDLQDGDKYRTIAGIRFSEGDVFEGKKLKSGDKLVIDGVDFKLVGILKRIGNDQDDSQLLIPLSAAEEIFSEPDYDTIMVRVKKGFEPSDVADDIKQKMRRDRNQKEGEEDFNVQTSEQLLESVGGVISSVQSVVVGIALISLMVGGIGIMNAMYTSVLERTQEIGVMKALGAKRDDILSMFLIEAGLMGAIGGVVGTIIGLVMSKSVEYYAVSQLNITLLKASTSPAIIFGAISFSFIVGCVSGVFPALQASKLRPVEALRYE
ncbi:MAG: ABC transporter permease [Candidatus Altiarchaeota archaeon]|nr:ABC transporter permease [Candidatus Altiarchaeota archaeon]